MHFQQPKYYRDLRPRSRVAIVRADRYSDKLDELMLNGLRLFYHLAMIYKETKQINEAQSGLKKAVGSPKDFKEKSLAQASLKEIASLR